MYILYRCLRSCLIQTCKLSMSRHYWCKVHRMSAITLRNESGGWEYTTTTDDSLFAPIIGNMVAEGMELPDILIIPGELGVAIEREWKYIALIEQWMEWEDSIIEDTIPTNYLTMDMDRLQEQLLDSKLTYHPPQLVYRHDIRVIANALSLQEGWEAYVAVDERTPLAERAAHAVASLEYFRTHTDHAALLLQRLDPSMFALYRRIEDPIVKETRKDPNYKFQGSLITPFLRNTQLIQGDKIITIPSMLVYFDWLVVIELILPYKDDIKTFVIPALTFAEVMLGREVAQYKLGHQHVLPLAINSVYGIAYSGKKDEVANIATVYSKILTHTPIEADIAKMGLEPILGYGIVRAWESPQIYNYNIGTLAQGVLITRLVGWINATTITYLAWNGVRTSEPHIVRPSDAKSEIKLSRSDFPTVVQFLGETLGLYAMRRILLSLLHYTKEKGNHKYSKQEVDRAGEFAMLLEEYLSGHEGENEDVRTLLLPEAFSSMMKKEAASSGANIVVIPQKLSGRAKKVASSKSKSSK